MPKLSPRKDSFADFQRAIAGTLMRPLGAGDTMRPDAAQVAEKFVRPNDRLTAFERLQIYNQQYWWRLLGAFREDFRGVRAVVGERKFERLAVAYLESCGSQSWSLRDLGQFMERFLIEHPELVAPHAALALDVARVEWARVRAFDGEEKPRVDPQKLQRIAPERLRFGIQPCVSLLVLSHPVDQLLGKLRLREVETGSASNAVTAKRRRGPLRLSARASEKPIHLAVHRLDFAVYYKRLEPAAYRLLLALREGATLADACGGAFENVAENDDAAAARVQAWFAQWMRFGWLCAR